MHRYCSNVCGAFLPPLTFSLINYSNYNTVLLIVQAASSHHSHDTNKKRKKRKTCAWRVPTLATVPTIYKREWTWLFWFLNSNAFFIFFFLLLVTSTRRIWSAEIRRRKKTPTQLRKKNFETRFFFHSCWRRNQFYGLTKFLEFFANFSFQLYEG